MQEKKKFVLEVFEPFSTFVAGEPVKIPYIIKGLATQGGLSALGGKAKHGKSSMSRYEAVCVSKGVPFLGRPVEQGEVLIASLEDPCSHVDNCLKVLNYNPAKDARIQVVSTLPRNIDETVDILAEHLVKNKDIRFVVLDTMAKVIRAKDSNDYDEMMDLLERLHKLARDFPKLHIQTLTHCKKIQPEDPFDGFLGSTAVRGEPDTNIVIFDRNGHRAIKSETRMGTSWEATILNAETVELDSTTMVKNFSLGNLLSEETAHKKSEHENYDRVSHEDRLVQFLKGRNGEAPLSDYRENVPGNHQAKLDAIDRLVKQGIVKRHGVSQSKTNPLRLCLINPNWSNGVIVRPQVQTPNPPTVVNRFRCNTTDGENYRCPNFTQVEGSLCSSCQTERGGVA